LHLGSIGRIATREVTVCGLQATSFTALVEIFFPYRNDISLYQTNMKRVSVFGYLVLSMTVSAQDETAADTATRPAITEVGKPARKIVEKKICKGPNTSTTASQNAMIAASMSALPGTVNFEAKEEEQIIQQVGQEGRAIYYQGHGETIKRRLRVGNLPVIKTGQSLLKSTIKINKNVLIL
jgi:hypothetical protein